MNETKTLEIFFEKMLAKTKKEQIEKVKNYQILNRNAIKNQILFTGSSLMEQ